MINTPYDDVFRTLLNDCSWLILPVINEVFNENYTGTEKIVFLPNEHFLSRQNGEETERITDTCFIIQNEVVKKYHWECQSTEDNKMLVRIFEYDAQIALDNGNVKDDVLTVEFPHSAILYLRSTVNTPDSMNICIKTPGGELTYAVPTMKVQKYSLREIFDKRLYFLLPFYIFTHENHFEEYDINADKLTALLDEYEFIKNRLEELCDNGTINEFTKCTVIDMSKKVLQHLAEKHEPVRKGVESVMGGKVLDYEAKRIRDEGISQGIEQGIEQGIKQGEMKAFVSLIKDGLLSAEEAAKRLQKSIDEIKRLL